MTVIDINKVDFTDFSNPNLINIGVSNHHLHLSQADLDTLFGHELTPIKDLTQPGQYACDETVDVVGPKGTLKGVRVLGPVRPDTQVEISQTEARQLGLAAPMRESGKVEGSASVTLVGPKATITIPCGCIVALTHVHLAPEEGEALGIKDKDLVDLYFKGEGKSGALFNVLARVGQAYACDIHIDTDEANAFRVKSGDRAFLVTHK